MANHPEVPIRYSPIRFSVVTISFNQARFLREAIESVLSQEGDGIEIEYIICDPGSKDDSRAIADSYGERIAHRVYERDDGPADGLNRGFAHATGDVFCYINSDDFFLPGAFARIARFLAQLAINFRYLDRGGDRHDGSGSRVGNGHLDALVGDRVGMTELLHVP